MAICSKTLDEDDVKKQLTITQTFDTEPFHYASDSGVMKIRDEQGTLWKFKYNVRPRNKRVLSGDWMKFVENNKVKVGDMVAIDHNDGWSPEANYKIEVISGGYQANY